MSIRCIRAGAARRRIHPFISFTRGPDSLRIRAFFFVRLTTGPSSDRAAPPATVCSLKICRKTCPGTGRRWSCKKRGCGAAGSARLCQSRGHGFEPRHPLHFGCALTAPPACSLGKGMAGCARGSAPCAASDPCVAPCPQLAYGHSRNGFRPGDGTGIHACLRSRILGVRLSPGAPMILPA